MVEDGKDDAFTLARRRDADRPSAISGLARSLNFARARGAADLLENFPHPAALVDSVGGVYAVSRSCKSLFLRSGLRLRGGRLESADGAGARDLAKAITAAVAQGCAFAGPFSVKLAREAHRPIIVRLTLMTDITSLGSPGARLILTFCDLDAQLAVPAEELGRLFGLTKAEAALAAELTARFSLEMAATSLGVTKTTARSTLKSVFAKLEVTRQSELVALLMKLPRLGPP